MGAAGSSLSELADNEYLKRLSGTEPINPMDPFWNQLLSFSFLIPVTSADARLMEESTALTARNFAINNCHTGNLRALVHNFMLRATELKASAQCEDNIFIWQTYNSLFIIRSLCKYFVEHLSEELLIQQFDCRPPNADGTPADDTDDEIGGQIEKFISALVELLVDVPVLNFTYALHLESLNTLLVLLSIQMFQPQPATQFNIYRYLMQGKCAIHAPLLVKVLLWNYINQEKCPPELYRSGEDAGLLSSVTAAVASSLWSVVTLGMGSKPKKKEEDEFTETLLANQSLLFLLVLTNHCTIDRAGVGNPYREALFCFTDSNDMTSVTQATATFKLEYSKMYDTLCATLRDDQTTLLLYLLIHQNQGMKSFILSRTNIDLLVLPLLRILYQAQERNSHHIYMALIILLVLSEDNVFNKDVHEITIKNDKYLHTNCLAALANMSAQFSNLHPFVAQKIISLFSQLCKRHARLIDQIRQVASDPPPDDETEGETQQDYIQDLGVLEEVLRMVLEIVNSCLTHSLHHNPHLVYTLLYQRGLFATFRTHPTFQDIIQNIDTVLSFFSARLDRNGSSLSPPQVLEIIKEGALQFRRDRLKKFPELKFKYVEEESPEEFFIPYIWSLVYHSSNLYFNPSRILLFSLATVETHDS
ncbi:hypothetical protein BaRGS_00032977 [Batillaria attramentaria]|uniref:Dymeclin n=1 Tax=Batillaria attramentaria TaxID=370345 RepID=A0ABD0JM65_9CAEN